MGIRRLHERYGSPQERADTEVSSVSALLTVSYRSQRTFRRFHCSVALPVLARACMARQTQGPWAAPVPRKENRRWQK